MAHRLSTIRSADKILVIRGGRITEAGTHDELLALSGYYYSPVSYTHLDVYKRQGEERRAAYNADITYGTNNEFGFDYLRDNMVTYRCV